MGAKATLVVHPTPIFRKLMIILMRDVLQFVARLFETYNPFASLTENLETRKYSEKRFASEFVVNLC